MKKNGPLFFFLLAVLLAFFAALTAVNAVQAFNKQVKAVVAAKDIPPYTKITSDMIKEINVSDSAIIGTSFNTSSGVVGKYTNTQIHQNLPITKELISTAPGGEVTAVLTTDKQLDIRALPIPVTSISGFGGKLDKGDRIDFIATINDTTTQGNSLVTSYIAQNIPVISRVEEGGKLVGVVVEVTAHQAQDISHYMETGRLKLAVQPQPSNHEVHIDPTTTKGLNLNTNTQTQIQPK